MTPPKLSRRVKTMARFVSLAVAVLTVAITATSTLAASPILDLNTFYLSDALSTTSDSRHDITVYSAFFGFNLDNKKRYVLGWNYGSYSTTNENGSTTKEYKSTQMGPGLIVFLNKGREWRLGVAYNLITTADYSETGSTSEEWTGTGLAADLGYQLYFTDAIALGLRVNYSSTSFSKKLVGSTQTDISYTKGIIYPSIAVTIEM